MKGDATDPARPGPLVLVVDDDPALRKYLRTGLAAHGFRMVDAATGEEALRAATQYVPDLILLDLGLPDLDGVVVMKRLRAWSRTPVIVLSARGEEASKVGALDAGADDYLTKPFGFAELLARMRASLRRAVQPDPTREVFEAGPLKIDFPGRKVTVNGREARLSPVEFKLLSELARHAGRVVTHQQLLESVWGPAAEGQRHYLRVYMTHLRRKLEPDPAQPRLFTTDAGFGYRLNMD